MDYWRVLRQRWLLVLSCIQLGIVGAVLITVAIPEKYEATSELFVAPDLGSTSSELMQGSDFVLDRVKSYVEIVDKAVILDPVIEDLGLDDTVGALSERVSATVVPETVVVRITVEDESAQEAADTANAIAAQFMATVPTLEPARTSQENSVVSINVVDPARTPLHPVSPNPTLNLILGLLAGMAAGLAAAVGREALDRRIKSEEHVKAVTPTPVMGSIPADRTADEQPIITLDNRHGVRAEALRQVRTNLQFLDVPQGQRSYVVTSSMPGEGKTLTAVNLAVTMAEGGLRVCLVEADLRRPRTAAYLGLSSTVGLTDALIGRADWSQVVQEYRDGMDVILAGTIPPNPSDLVVSDAMEQLLQRLQQAYDVVLVDAPPLLPVTDAAVLSKRCAGAIVVVGFGRKAITANELSRSLQMLTTVGARALGIVINKVPQNGPNVTPLVGYTYTPAKSANPRHGARAAAVDGGETVASAQKTS
ncbi:polysaccharide biosynthesis tyrosine autokinase [Ornithinimicrobium sufpigmenti]|uniref:polysaccharide biosynthesis tyrosine autokinase n=1 Tax=Ornithinimicrobium sufpigmenti TaxID=2508882 RepID=UPI00235754D8|nr:MULTISPECIES: polysaccharide biosynthesis tyrosine autokinase [unclassified Ornithinimicrobium]